MSAAEKATREHTKVHNKRLIFKTIYDQGEVSRVDIARQTSLTRTTVSSNVSELIDEGLVQEVGFGTSVGGKPPTLLSLVDDARHVIGLDLSSSQLRGALVNLRGVVRHQVSVPLAGRQGSAALELVDQLIESLVAKTNQPLLGIGIGAPGIIDAAQGTVRQAVNLDWYDVPLRERLAKRYRLPVYVANDSHVAAIAEYTFGQHKQAPNLAVVKVGRGIGMGIVLNGQLFYGDGGGAGEIGHIVVVDNGTLCRCGNFGCLETIASSRAIVDQARMSARYEARSSLNQTEVSLDDLELEHVIAAWRAGDPTIAPIVSNAGRSLGIALAYIVGALNIRHIIITGTVAAFDQALLEPLRAQLDRRALRTLVEQTQIERSTLGQDIVILGAAALLLAHELGLN